MEDHHGILSPIPMENSKSHENTLNSSKGTDHKKVLPIIPESP
jgi:hypothetical protein